MLEFFQSVGVKCRYTEALYRVIIMSRNFFGICVSTMGLKPSGPGDFLALNPLKISGNLSRFIQLPNDCLICSKLPFLFLSYFVAFFRYTWVVGF